MHLLEFIGGVTILVFQHIFLPCHSRHCDNDQPHLRGVWYQLFSYEPSFYLLSGDIDMEWFQSKICDNSFCAASYSKETRGGKKPLLSKTIPPEIDNTADLSYLLLNLDDETDQCNDDGIVVCPFCLPAALSLAFHQDQQVAASVTLLVGPNKSSLWQSVGSFSSN